VAEQSGKWCAKNIAAALTEKPGQPFHYIDKGIMAMIGRNAAVAELGKHRHELQGPMAFAAWLGVHAVLLNTARAKLETIVEWGWDYFGGATADPVLDRTSQMNIDWSEDDSESPQPGIKN
jgi:NADH dehydrogenase